MSGQWFGGGFERAREVKAEQESGVFDFGNNEKSRFWTSIGTDRKIIFLDDFAWKIDHGDVELSVIPFCFHEHKVDLHNEQESWKNCLYVACSMGVGPCKFCESSFKRPYVGAMTVLDVTPFTDKETGEVRVVARKKLVVASTTALDIIGKKLEKKGNLLGWQFSVTKHQKMDPRVGSDFEPEEEFTAEELRAKYEKVNLDPLGFTAEKASEFYRKVFQPLAYERQEKLFKNSITDGSVFRAQQGDPVSAGKSAGGSEETIEY